MTLPENHLGHADAVRRWPRWPSTSPQSTSAAGSAPPPPPPPTSRDPMWRTTPTTPCPTRPQSGGMGAEVFFLGWWCLVGYLMGINGSSSPYFPFFVGYHSGSFSPFFPGTYWVKKGSEVMLHPNVAPPVESSNDSEWLRCARILCAAMTSKPIPL